ncbi:MAG: arginine--tRNA ligase [Alphaproteobacteria bacterium]|nr:arginine--tRNA ligase [Alphaproteobacteria bacterium]
MVVPVLLDQLSHLVGNAFSELGFDAERGRVVYSARPDLGQFQCNGAMACAKQAGKNPMEIAEKLAFILQAETAIFARVEVARPGFLNLDVTAGFLAAHAAKMAKDGDLGGYRVSLPQKVMIDYCGPNVAKSMHVGHLRTSIIGNSLYRLFKHVGHEVVSDIHLGDWGLQMGMLISEIKRNHPNLPYFDADKKDGFPAASPVTLAELEVMYPKAATDCKADEARMAEARLATQELQSGHAGYHALWRHFVDVSLSQVRENLALLDVDFDLWLGESDVQSRIAPMVERMKAKNIAVQSEGAWIIPVAEEGDKKELPPLMLVKSDGAALYSTTDLATIEQRVEQVKPDLVLYVVDQRQHLHFEQVFRVAKKADMAPATSFEHIGYGTVNGKDGKPFKTREGGVMRLRGLIDLCVDTVKANNPDMPEDRAKMVAIAALKFADLSTNRLSGYVFDAEKFVSTEGRTGPYLQYACVRVQSMVEKSDINPGEIKINSPEEMALILMASRYPLALKEAVESREPSVISEYAYELAQSFSRFYAACPIAKAADPKVASSRMALAQLAYGHISTCLDILGIQVPERM